MKLERKSIEVVGGFAQKNIKASISKDNMSKMWDMLQSPYKNSIGSIVREVTSNIIDSHTEAKVNDAGIVRYAKDESGFYVSFIDVGVGLSEDRIENVFSSYLSSTKEDSDDFIGAWGLGSKSPLSYQDMFYINTRLDGIEYNYIMRKGEEGPEIDLITSSETTERNGTEIKLYIRNENDLLLFLKETFEQLHFFENIVIDVENIAVIYTNGYDSVSRNIMSWCDKLEDDYHLIKGEHFIYRTNTASGTLSLAIGNVKYPIDWINLGMSPISATFALQFNIGDLPVIQTREDIRYTDKAIKTIKEKIELVKEEMITLYNKDSNAVLDNIQSFLDQDLSANHIKFTLPDTSIHTIHINGLSIPKNRSNPYQIKDFPYQFKSIEENKSFNNFLNNTIVFDKSKHDPFINYLRPLKSFKTNGSLQQCDKVILKRYQEFNGSTRYSSNSFSKIFQQINYVKGSDFDKKLFTVKSAETVNNKTNKYIQEVLYKDVPCGYMYILKKGKVTNSKRFLYGIYQQFRVHFPDLRVEFKDIVNYITKEIESTINNVLIDYDKIKVPEQWWKDRLAANRVAPKDYDRSLMAIERCEIYKYQTYGTWNRKDHRIDLKTYIKGKHRQLHKHNIVLLTKDEQKELCSHNNDSSTRLEYLSIASRYFFEEKLTKSYFTLDATSTRNYNKILENRLPESNIYSLTEYLNDKKMQTRVLGKILAAIKIKDDISSSFIFNYGTPFDKLEDVMKVMNPDLLKDYQEINNISNQYNIKWFRDIQGFLQDLQDVSMTVDIFDKELWNKYLDIKRFIAQSKINFVNNAFIELFYFTQTYKLEDIKFKLNNVFYKSYTKSELVEKCIELSGYQIDVVLNNEEQLDIIKKKIQYDVKLGFVTGGTYHHNADFRRATIDSIIITLLIMKFEFEENMSKLEVPEVEAITNEPIAGELEFVGSGDIVEVEEINV